MRVRRRFERRGSLYVPDYSYRHHDDLLWRRFPRPKRVRRLRPRAPIVVISQSTSAHPNPMTDGVATTISFAVACNVGDLIILGINWGNNVGTYAVSDDAGNRYTQFPSVQIGVAAENDLNAFWAIAVVAATTISLTITGGGNHGARLALFALTSSSGWQSSPVDVGNSAAQTSSNVTTGTPGNITPARSGELIVSMIQWGNVVSSISLTPPFLEEPTAGGTAGTGWVSDGRADSAMWFSGSNQSLTSTYNWTTSITFTSLICAFKPNFTTSIEYARSASNTSSTAGTSIVVTVTVNVGDTVVVACATVGTAIQTPTDTGGNTYVALGNSVTNTDTVALFVCLVAKASATSVTMHCTSSRLTCCVACYTGNGNVHLVGTTNSATGANPTITTTQLSPSGWICAGLALPGTTASTALTGRLRIARAGAGSTTPSLALVDDHGSELDSIVTAVTHASGAWAASSGEITPVPFPPLFNRHLDPPEPHGLVRM